MNLRDECRHPTFHTQHSNSVLSFSSIVKFQVLESFLNLKKQVNKIKQKWTKVLFTQKLKIIEVIETQKLATGEKLFWKHR